MVEREGMFKEIFFVVALFSKSNSHVEISMSRKVDKPK